MGNSRSETRIIFLVLLLTWLGGPQASPVSAQSDKAVTVQSSDPGQGEDSRLTFDDNSSHRSVNGRFLADMRSPIGFSVGLWELYVPSLSPLAPSNKSTPYTLVQPGIFVKIRKRQSEFHLDYAFGYRRDSQIHTSDQSARVEYIRQMSRNVTLQVSDTARSVFNDFGFLQDASATWTGSTAQQLYVPRQRTITNAILVNMNYRAGKNTDFSVFGTYDTWRYRPTGIGDLNGAQAGFASQNRINRWLFLDNRYSHYVTIDYKSPAASQAFQPGSIDSMHVGGLTFRPRKTLNVSFAGGGELVRFQTGERKTGSFEGSVAYKSRSSLLALVYHRGFSTAAGPGATLNGQTASVSLNQALSRRVSFQIGSGYTTGTALAQHFKVEYLSANAELDVAILRNLVFSAQYSHVSQKGANLPVNTPVMTFQTATAGLRFFLPSSGR
jgi:hypothetical protein